MGALAAVLLAIDPYVIRVVDEASGRGVPLATLRTTSGLALVTDNAGVVAFEEPGLLGRRVFFFVESPGYEIPADGFGIRGVALDTVPGGTATVHVRRTQVAERLYRITGQGLYHHSARAGLPVPIHEPLLNAGVMGQDTAVAVVRGDEVRWFWGDTNLPGYALGHFGTATATAKRSAIDPAVGIDLVYAVDAKGLSRPTFPPGPPAWVHGAFAIKDPQGRDRIVTQYERVKTLSERVELGLALFDDAGERFEVLKQFDIKEERHPFGQAFRHEGFIYFSLPYPMLRVKEDWEAVQDPGRYESWSCLEGGELRRGSDGQPEWRWRTGALPWTWERQGGLIKSGVLRPGEGWIRTLDAATGKEIRLHRGSVRWNAYRKRWLMVATRSGAEESFLGEVYVAEAERPEGPWPKAVKVATHPGYTFYNPVHHDFLDREGGRLIHFEGTYTMTFSSAKVPVPRYEYNQLMYRLDLSLLK